MKREQNGRNEIMTIAEYNIGHNENLREMQAYIDAFRQQDRSIAKQKAKESLIRSGVLNADGSVKKQICNR